MSVDTTTMLDLEQLVNPFEDTDDGNDHHTHIVRPTENAHLDSPGATSADIVSIARMTGQEVTALCGYKWIPKRDPKKYPVCNSCLDIAEAIVRSKG